LGRAGRWWNLVGVAIGSAPFFWVYGVLKRAGALRSIGIPFLEQNADVESQLINTQLEPPTSGSFTKDLRKEKREKNVQYGLNLKGQ
jgi:hypothetical protein